jgi:hypothetical protein
MNDLLLWLHPDCLAADNPAFAKYPGARAVFIWDEEEIEEEAWTLKRIQFLYESLLEIPAEIHRGPVVPKLTELLRAANLRKIATVDSVNPRFKEHRRLLEMAFSLEVLPPVPFVDYRGHLDLKRFSRYWKRVEPVVFDK